MTQRHIETRQRAKVLRTEQSPVEARLWAALRGNRTGVKFVRQMVIAPYVADFAARSERLVVEIDGDSHAGRESADAVRTAHIEALGFRVIRFTNRDVITDLEGVVRCILVALGRDPEAG